MPSVKSVRSTASSPPASAAPGSPRQDEVTSLLPPSRPRTPRNYAQPLPKGKHQARKASVGGRSVSGRSILSGLGGYGATDNENPMTMPARVTREGQKRVLTTAPILLSFWLLVMSSFVSVVMTLLLLIDIVVEADVPKLPSRSSGFLEFWISAVGSWIGLGSLLFFSHPSKIFFITSLIAFLLHIPLTMLLLLSPALRATHWAFFLLALIPTALTVVFSLLANYLVRRAKWLESMRIYRMLPAHGNKDNWAQAVYGLREKGFWHGLARIVRGIIGLISGLAAALIVSLLLIDLSITAYDHGTDLPNRFSQMITVRPAGSPISTVVHLACVDPANTTSLALDSSLRKTLPTVLYEPPSGVPGSLALLEKPFRSKDAPYPGRWIFDMQAKGEVGKICIWDRPGYGFSQIISSSDLGIVADAVWDALELAGETKASKFLLAAEGYGGLVSRVLAGRHPSAVHSYLHIDAQTSLTYFSEPPSDLAYLKLQAHRLTTRLFPTLVTPLSLVRLPSVLFKQSSSLSRILASRYTRTTHLNENLRKALLQETFSSHTHQSASFAALVKSGETYPIRPSVVLSSAERMEQDENWAEGQRVLAEDVSQSGLIKWAKVPHVGHYVCRGEGLGTCKEALRVLLAS